MTAGAFQTTYSGEADVFVTKLDPPGASFAYSTYMGGTGSESPNGIAVDPWGSAYVAGYTTSTNFPTTSLAFDRTKNGVPGDQDAFVTKLDAAGSAPIYSTFLGGDNYDEANDLVIDSRAYAYVTGQTCSTDFPRTPGALQTNANGGCDAFVTKLNFFGSDAIMSTYFGGSFGDVGYGIAVDSERSVYITGLTTSGQNANDFPTTPGAFQSTGPGDYDAFVAKISSIGIATTLTLSPPTATNVVGSQHCVTATVTDEFGSLMEGVPVRFFVGDPFGPSGTVATDANGTATFCYTGPDLPGTDTITAFADVDKSGIRLPDEPEGSVEKTWVSPATTPLCDIKIANNSSIVAVNGDKATFSGSARSLADGTTQGQQDYQDQGPHQRLKMRSINVQAVVCTGSGAASIYGQATIDGAGPFAYRIDVQDLAKPGKGADTYRISLANGYESREQILQGGNVQIQRD